jgi:hypothetical protein
MTLDGGQVSLSRRVSGVGAQLGHTNVRRRRNMMVERELITKAPYNHRHRQAEDQNLKITGICQGK